MKISLSYKSSFLFPLLPVLLAWWWSVLAPVLTPELAGWSRVWPQALVLLLQFLPLLLCQAVGGWLQQQTAPKRMVIAAVGLFWVLGMLAYPAFFLFADSSGWLKFGENEWLL
ncbi:MAG: hypothetical protein KKB45_12705, partial [Gammaproteobacteria bacterium]|nr:hypothetical protein [Gammaproteobacteria bacterium]